eukprot:Hpha_TRINITY_DN13221_c1_g1::TRINITY_DN13221_c1_g1_i1::g.154771::m.154771
MTKAVPLLLLALTGCAPVDGKGNGVPTRTYGKPNNANNAYKYAGAAAAGGLVGYWVGSRRFTPRYGGYGYSDYNSYHNHYSGRDSSWNSRYGRNRRSTNCQPRTRVPQPEWTRAYVWVQAVIGVPSRQLQPIELETDLFRDLVWRSPCNVPTQVLISYVCNVQTRRRITATDQSRPATCQYLGSVESVHSLARRNLLQGGYTVVEMAVGIRNSAGYNDMLTAIRESLDDPYSAVAQAYGTGTNGTTTTAVIHYEFHESAATARALGAIIMGTIFAFVNLVL